MNYLEKTIAEDHYLKGEKLLEEEAVLEVLQLEKSLWSVMIRDNGVLEVEIQKPGTKKQKSTCECKTFAKENSCPHIAAALLHLRNLEDERAAIKKKKEKDRLRKHFNVRTIMDTIDIEELKNYVKSYAQKDKTFGTMFKATFAKSIELADNSIKYESLLNSLIKPMSTERLKSSSADLRNALKVIDEFHAQLEDHISISNYEEAFTILETTLPKIHYIYSKYGLQNEKVVTYLAKFHDQINNFYVAELAPDFLSRVDHFVVDLYDKSYFNHLEKIDTPYIILDQNHRIKACEKIAQILSNRNQLDAVSQGKVGNALMLLTTKNRDKGITDDEQLEAIKYLITQKYTTEAIVLLEAEIANNHENNKRRNRKLELALIEAYDLINDDAKYNQLAIDIYSKYGDIKYYNLLKSKTPEAQWSSIQVRILSAMEQYESTSSLRASFYHIEGLTDRLLDLLQSENDLRHIMKYDVLLYREHFVRLEEIYKGAITNYLDSHVGQIANRFIEEVLHHLSISKAYKLEKSIKSHIQQNYSHRLLLEW